jgi:hypothetical protein
VTVPLAEGETGDVRLEVREQGIASPATVALRARAESSRIDSVEIHAGDNEAVVTGQRLEQVLGVSLGDIDFRPDGLTRQGRTDRLHLTAQNAAGQNAASQNTAGQSATGQSGGPRVQVASRARQQGQAGWARPEPWSRSSSASKTGATRASPCESPRRARAST